MNIENTGIAQLHNWIVRYRMRYLNLQRIIAGYFGFALDMIKVVTCFRERAKGSTEVILNDSGQNQELIVHFTVGLRDFS